jgi:predicted RNA binding protein YcfA (HicA-like mRNA interferase family)
MDADEKLIEKLKRKPTPDNISFAELRRLLIHLGFREINGKGSHIHYKHDKHKEMITISNHGEWKSVDRTYLFLVLKALDELERRNSGEYGEL